MKKGIILLMLFFALTAAFTATAQDVPAAATTIPAVQLEGQLTLEDIHALNDGKEHVFEHDGALTLLDGTATADPVRSEEDAAKTAVSMISLMGGDIRTELIPWRIFSDTEGNVYYVFQQISGGVTISGGAVKVIADKDGNMIGLSASLVSDLPDVSESLGITAEEAEQIVLNKAGELWNTPVRLIEDVTDKIILPLILSIDDEEHEETDNRYVWVVYTENPALNAGQGADLPFLAHYVTMDGEYLYSLETIFPGDQAGETGFDTVYIFEFMEPAEYTGYVDLSDGTEMELTVTVMRDKRTGMYYLGNIERQIVIADCWEFLYNNGSVVLEYSPDNREWDQVALLSFYNYCRAYDYYREIGWIGGDGKGTPIMVLNNFCDENHVQIDNAAFMGNYLGWSLFASSRANDFSQCLDVIAHEFTHCVTGSVMTYNSYQNDFGAINEAMSDIQGNNCELMYGDEKSDQTLWIVGDNSQVPIRSMSAPHDFSQPEYSWDFYYKPSVKIPTPLNDRGGVHSNSSLLNNVYYRLITEGGMSYEEARAYWFAVDCTMVPGTDYAQLVEIMPWVLKTTHMEQYADTLQNAIEITRMADSSMPETIEPDRAVIRLTLPDNENFKNGNWMLQIYSVNVEELIQRGSEMILQLQAGDYSQLPEPIVRRMNEEKNRPTPTPEPDQKGFLEQFFSLLLNGPAASDEPVSEPVPADQSEDSFTEEDEAELRAWGREKFGDIIYSDTNSAGQDLLTINMMSRPGRSIPILMHMSFSETSDSPDQVVMLAFINGRWYEIPGISNMFSEDAGTSEEPDPAVQEQMDTVINKFVDDLMKTISESTSLEDFANRMIVRINGGELLELPAVGLENIVLPEPGEHTDFSAAGASEVPGRKSRPKTTND